MKTKHILMGAVALTVITACDDYTDRNFGTRDELYQPTQVNHHVIDLTDAHYAAVAADATNMQAAADADVTERLQRVAANHCFNSDIAPEEYLLPILQQLVGKTQFYTMDAGSTITVNCMLAEQTLVDDPAYVPFTAAFTAGKYLLAPVGQEQPLGTSGLTAEGEHPGYGYLYLAGGDKCPAVNPFGTDAYTIDDTSKQYLYAFDKDGDHFTIRNAAGYYLYLDGSHASFQYTDDLQSDCDDPDQGLWDVKANDDATYDITNVATGQQLRYDTSYKSAGCYSPDKQTDNHVGVTLYKEGKVSGLRDADPEPATVIFSYDGSEWAAKADYINQTLLGQTSTDVETIYALSGWSLEFIGGIGDLTYVWKLDGTYGLRASAYKSSTYYPTDAWAISPTLNLKKAKQPLLTFEEAQKYAGTPLEDYLQVLVTTDYTGRGALQTAHWTDVTTHLVGATKDDGSQWTRPDGSDWTYATMTLDLSDYAGNPDVRVAFRYISTDAVAATWEVKNVVCKEKE